MRRAGSLFGGCAQGDAPCATRTPRRMWHLSAVILLSIASSTCHASEVPVAVPTPSANATCITGSDECPVELHMARGHTRVAVTADLPAGMTAICYAFKARAGQALMVRVDGDVIKAGSGLALVGPDGREDSVDPDAPYILPADGLYRLRLPENTMAEHVSRRYTLRVTIARSEVAVPRGSP